MLAHANRSDNRKSAISRRGLLTVAGAAALAAVAATDVSAEEKKKSERAYEGESKDGKLQDALDKALQQLDKDLGEGGVADASASWKLVEVTGQRGGIAGFHGVKVKISAARSPEWGKK